MVWLLESGVRGTGVSTAWHSGPKKSGCISPTSRLRREGTEHTRQRPRRPGDPIPV